MSIEKIKEIANTELVNLFSFIINNENNLAPWHGRSTTKDNMQAIHAEVQSKGCWMECLLHNVIDLQTAFMACRDVEAAVKSLIEQHTKYADIYPSPTTVYMYQQRITDSLENLMKQCIQLSLISNAQKVLITEHLSDQKRATTTSGASYSFFYMPAPNTKTNDTVDHTESKKNPFRN